MAKHQWSILCRRSIVDKFDNTISIIDGVESITILAQLSEEELNEVLSEEKILMKVTPSIGLQLVSLWIRSDRQKPEIDNARVQVKNPKDKILLTQEYEVNLVEPNRQRHKLHFSVIPFDGAGVYRYMTQQRKGTEKNPRWVTVSELFIDLIGPSINPPNK